MATTEGMAKYIQIAFDIIQRIRSGELEPGMKVPSENEIIAAYGVSNTTARKALQQVELQGFANRIKGRGTFVRHQSVTRSATKILSFSQNMKQAGLTPSSKVLHAELVKGGYSVTINGRTYRMTEPMYKVHRLRYGDDMPMLLEVRYISAMLCPGITEKDLASSLYRIYEQEYGLQLTEVKQLLTPIILDSATMGFFNLEHETPGMLLEGVTFCGKETILEMERSVYRGDTYQFSVSATT